MAARFPFPNNRSPGQDDEEFEALMQRIDDLFLEHVSSQNNPPSDTDTDTSSDNKYFTPTTEFKETPAQRLFTPSPEIQPPSFSPSPIAPPDRPLANSGCQYESPTIAFQTPDTGERSSFANPNYQFPTPSADAGLNSRCAQGYQHQTPGSSDVFVNPGYQHQTPDGAVGGANLNLMYQNLYAADSPDMVDTTGEEPFTPGVGEVYQLDPNWYQKYESSSEPEPRRKNPYAGQRNPNQQAAPAPQMFPPRIRSPSEGQLDMFTRELSLSCHVAHSRGLPVPGDRAAQRQPHNVPVTFNPNIRQDIATARLECMENLPMPRDTTHAQLAIEQIWKTNQEIIPLLRKMSDFYQPEQLGLAHAAAKKAMEMYDRMSQLYAHCMPMLRPEVFSWTRLAHNTLAAALRRPDRNVAVLATLACRLIRLSQSITSAVAPLRGPRSQVSSNLYRNLRQIRDEPDSPEVDQESRGSVQE